MKFFKRARNSGFIIPDFSNSVKYFDNTKCKILDGKLLSSHFVTQAQNLRSGRKIPCLAVILAGDNPASQVYVNNKIKIFKEAGFESQSFFISKEESTEKKLFQTIDMLNKDDNVDGILVQLPLPNGLNTENILNRILPQKDVDGFLAHNLGTLATGELNSAIACTPFGVMALLYAYGIDPSGKNTVVIGRSNIVGKPMSLLLLSADATVTIAHSKTQNLIQICQNADILVAAAGQPEMVTKDFIKKDAIVIDVGIHRKENRKLCGDTHQNVKEIASALTPVPGGVGPMTIAMLMLNTALAAWNK
ncbi:bifunctional methylenetetrahydrofolate dehydrogenase/methenyltetrahydrofolate cyclohydrolase [Silvanigrella paludirubra]|uniref:Bifunctional protein FolD n=1 Tax=Silvanigrella paludirubra TaxID=2499159 RepID=A0A6N6VRW5_9BACT|nr:bifunctional 5,10-methylenetetrahydrofolate dehydrogenase/5,10-methenyltetrahydrofolate cyclohydrolase [Silvanigrella paludirubra]KAB8036095.1 bifunctional methylenetetrahydrofolate dehydrogenase/methenyltetrahydrofolate cyclohydrolase [Silvanigrella paludirubra]